MESNNVFPLFCFGHLAWFKALLQAKNIVFDVNETFTKRTYRNRYTLLNSQGRTDLTVPLSNKSSNLKTKEIEIDYTEDWITQHLRTIKAGYSLSPFYLHYIDDLKAIFYTKPKILIDLNLLLFEFTIEKLGIDLSFTLSESFPNKSINTYWRFEKVPNKKAENLPSPYYPQQFEDRLGYFQNPSILDLLFNLGPEGRLFLK